MCIKLKKGKVYESIYINMLEYELQKMYHQVLWYIHILWYDDLIMYLKYYKFKYTSVYILKYGVYFNFLFLPMTSPIPTLKRKNWKILVVCEPILISTIYSYLATCINNSHNRNCRWGNLMLINLLLMKRGPALIWRGYSGHAE